MRLVLTPLLLASAALVLAPSSSSGCAQGSGWGSQNLEIVGSCSTAPPVDGSEQASAATTIEDSSLRNLPARDFRCRLGDIEACNPDPAVGVAPITVADLASFTPAVGELVVQPENWGVLGIPTNFVATATDHVQQGTLLGQPIEVRWRPVAFTFDYGDGTVVTTSDAGAMWHSSEDDWTATSTSHEYDARGEYTASVTITFEADIATGTGWATVPGTLDLAAPAEPVQVFEVQTVLTRGDCIEYPSDPGCSP